MTKIPIHGHCDSRFSRVRDVFEENFRKGTDLGASVCIVLDGETVVDLWGGHLDKDRTEEWQEDTLVNVYSTTKGMTAICANQLIEAGKLDPDAKVAEYWPEFAAGGKEEITVRQLLSHQAGLPAIRRPMPADALFDWDSIVTALAETEPWWEPGTRHGYHAVTFGHLAGELIRRISGQSPGRYFAQHVAGPLSADVHIGLDADHHDRVSDLHGNLIGGDSGGSGEGGSGRARPADAPELPDALRQFMKDMADPTTMTGGAFNNPPIRPGTVNSTEWREAEIPAANGHATARGLARIYGVLARGGEQDGVRVLGSEAIDRAIEEQVYGPDAVLGGMPMRFGLGFMLRQPIMPFSPSPRAFGHPGAGGSIGMADPDAKVGFGYTMNKMQMGLVGGAGAFAMLHAFFEDL